MTRTESTQRLLEHALEAARLLFDGTQLDEAEAKAAHGEYGLCAQALVGALVASNERLHGAGALALLSAMSEMGMSDRDDEAYWLWLKAQEVLSSDGDQRH